MLFKILITLFCTFSLQTAYGFSINGEVVQDESNAYQRVITVTCNQETSNHCKDLCGDGFLCRGKEPVCLNCAGTTWNILKVLFTKFEYNYEIDKAKDLSEIVKGLKQQEYIFLDSGSIYNYYGPIYSEKIQRNFESFCPNKEDKAIVGLKLHKTGIPAKVDFLICKSADNTDYFLEINEREIKTPGLTNSGTLTIKENP